jgi:NifU-like protein involved in Fe-S cluster formation
VTQFTPQVLDHFKKPRHARPIASPDGVGWVKRSESRFMQIQVVLKDHRIDAIAFGTYGCAPSIACGSWVCEWAYAKPVAQALTLQASAVLGALGGLPAHQRDCATMAVDALHQALDNAVRNQREATAAIPPVAHPGDLPGGPEEET